MKKILIVDDDGAILEALQISMETSGYQVEVENSGTKALIKAKDWRPDLILLDFLLPDKKGDEITRHLKSHHQTKNIPVIIISAHMMVKEIVSECGADDFIAKPFNIDDLLVKIRGLTS